ncbi:MAG: 2Fe-2S iron-sulfur cluster-binding protein [Thermodesulfovibrionales bacterium]
MTKIQMINIEINGKKIEAPEGTTVLEAARKEGIDIPTLCYHRALGPKGVCRLCIVEIEGPGLDHMVTTSCNCRVSEGLFVETATARIQGMRKVILNLLLSGTASTSPLKALAGSAGIRRRKYGTVEEDKCILCGLCVYVCRESIKAGALRFETAGDNGNRVVEFVALSEELCIGCGTCAALCPVGAIRLVDEGAERSVLLYGKVANTLRLKTCEECGGHYTTEKFAESILYHLDKELRKGVKNLCPDCARQHYVVALTGQFLVG